MLKSFKFRKTINLGNVDAKRHGYETEEFEAVSDESFDEAKQAVLDQVNARLVELINVRDRVEASKSVPTRA